MAQIEVMYDACVGELANEVLVGEFANTVLVGELANEVLVGELVIPPVTQAKAVFGNRRQPTAKPSIR